MADIKVECKLIERYQTVVGDTRGHMIVCDLPPEKGGYDQATSAIELAAMALGDCIVTIFALKAMGARIRLEDVKLTATAFRPEGAPTITAVKGRMVVISSASEEDIKRAFDETLATCPVGILFKEAGCPIEISLKIRHPK